VPWPGDHADDELPEDPGAEGVGAARPPLPPDDRLWRHPSELAAAPSAAGPPAGPAPLPSAGAPRLWSMVLAAGLSGAALALAMVALVGGFGDDVTQRVTERVPAAETVAGGPADAEGVVGVAEAVSPSIVRIETALDGITGSSGSGVVIRDDGTILTNAHVVAEADTITIVLADGTGLPGHVVGSDASTDVAVVVVDDSHRGSVTWEPAVLGSAEDLRVGEQAVAIGSPLGLAGGPSVTVGVVSGLGRRVVAEGEVLHDMIQTDAPIARGSSGGALCDGSGVVVGLTTAVASSATGSDGLGFAIPIDLASDIADRIVAEGVVRWVWLGIEGSDLAPTEASMPGLPETGGVRVDAVSEGGPAADAGVQGDDVVVAVDGTRIATMSDLVVALRSYRPGDVVDLQVRRAGEDLSMVVTLAERPG
jgi:putative serine protease PepD